MADVDGGLVPGDFVEFAVDFILRNRVKGGGGLVQDQEGRVLVECPGQSDFLSLSAGNLDAAAVKLLVQEAVRALRHGGQALSEAGFD